MRANLFFILPLLFLPAACSVIPEQSAPPRQFDFGPLPEQSATRLPPISIQPGPVRSPPWLDGHAIQYRLLYDQPEAYRVYARHVWVAPPAEILAQRLSRGLFNPAPPDTASPRLHLSLDTFEQVFETPRSAHASMRLRASVIDTGGRQLAGETFSARRPATPDVHGAITALPALADELLTEVLDWLTHLQLNRQSDIP